MQREAMKPVHIILMLVLVVVIFAGTIFLFIFKSFSGSGARSTPSTPNAPATTTTTGNDTTSPTNTDQTPAEADTHSAIDDCVELKAYEAKDKDFERGSLLVSFYPAVSYSLAVDSMKLLGLNVQTSDSSRSTFNQNHWLTVLVPAGKEFLWQCQLDASEGVKKANLNLIFRLRQ